MAGIKETKEVLDFGLSTAMFVDEKLQDGFQWTDIFGMVEPLTKAPAAIDNIDEVPKELADMDEEERAELVRFVQDTYDIADDNAEKMVEQGIRAAIELVKLILILRGTRA